MINKYYELNLVLEQTLFESKYFRKNGKIRNYCTDGQYFSRIWNEILLEKDVKTIELKEDKNGTLVSIYGKETFVENIYSKYKELALVCCYLIYKGFDLNMRKLNEKTK